MDTQTTIWQDVNGRTRATYVNSASGSVALQAALKAVSEADIQRSWNGTTIVNPAPTPSTGSYQTVADYATLVFQTASSDLVYLTLIAPQSSIFLADGETVNSAAIAALIAAALGTLTDQGGNVVTSYVAGFRRRSGREYQ